MFNVKKRISDYLNKHILSELSASITRLAAMTDDLSEKVNIASIQTLNFASKFEKISQNRKFTFSQCGEDRVLSHIMTALRIETPSYIDVGAHHPTYLNNTALFYENGSRGINIEPNPFLFKNFLIQRNEDINLNIGIADQETILPFYILNESTLSTFSKTSAQEMCKKFNYRITKKMEIKVDTLKNVILMHCNNTFPDMLFIDAEGLDEIIIKTLCDLDTLPKTICVETVEYAHSGIADKSTEIPRILSELGFFVYADTNINTIFVNKSIWTNRY